MEPRDEMRDGTARVGSEPRRAASERRRPYAPPRLEVLGDVRDLTMGGSPGVGDSGNAAVEKSI